MASQDFSAPFTLYFSAYSICATMVRVTFEMRGKPRPDRPEMNMSFQMIDIGHGGEQLSQHYLCEVNPKGEVPVLVNDKLLSKPMPDSRDISHYLSDWYPELLPTEHKIRIEALLAELHSIDYAALTFGTQTSHFVDLLQKCEAILKSPGIPAHYREALELKRSNYSKAPVFLTAERTAEQEVLTREFLVKIIPLLEKSQSRGGGFIFGAKPTMLDAHVLIFLCRLYDANRKYLISDCLLQWVEDFRRGPVWKRIVPGGSTLPPYINSEA